MLMFPYREQGATFTVDVLNTVIPYHLLFVQGLECESLSRRLVHYEIDIAKGAFSELRESLEHV